MSRYVSQLLQSHLYSPSHGLIDCGCFRSSFAYDGSSTALPKHDVYISDCIMLHIKGRETKSVCMKTAVCGGPDTHYSVFCFLGFVYVTTDFILISQNNNIDVSDHV